MNISPTIRRPSLLLLAIEGTSDFQRVDVKGTGLRCARRLQGPKDGDGQISRVTAISFGADKAAIAAKWAKPLDLHTVAIRNDLGESLRPQFANNCRHLSLPEYFLSVNTHHWPVTDLSKRLRM